MSAVEVFGCPVCGIPRDAGFFDVSMIRRVPPVGRERVLARYELPRNYCGVLLYFAQFTDLYAKDPSRVLTSGLRWQIRYNGHPQYPYLTFGRIINPWGLQGFPIALRLEETARVELVVRNVGVRLSENGAPLDEEDRLEDDEENGKAQADVHPPEAVPPDEQRSDPKDKKRPNAPKSSASHVGAKSRSEAKPGDGSSAQATVAPLPIEWVGGRLLGRYWYNAAYGGAPNLL